MKKIITIICIRHSDFSYLCLSKVVIPDCKQHGIIVYIMLKIYSYEATYYFVIYHILFLYTCFLFSENNIYPCAWQCQWWC